MTAQAVSDTNHQDDADSNLADAVAKKQLPACARCSLARAQSSLEWEDCQNILWDSFFNSQKVVRLFVVNMTPYSSSIGKTPGSSQIEENKLTLVLLTR